MLFEYVIILKHAVSIGVWSVPVLEYGVSQCWSMEYPSVGVLSIPVLEYPSVGVSQCWSILVLEYHIQCDVL